MHPEKSFQDCLIKNICLSFKTLTSQLGFSFFGFFFLLLKEEIIMITDSFNKHYLFRNHATKSCCSNNSKPLVLAM